MYPLFESICVQDGRVLYSEWHRLRFEKAYQSFFKKTPTYDLLDPLIIPQKFCRGKVKLKICYNENKRDLGFQHYQMQNIQSLKLVYTNHLDYTFKYSNRESLDALFDQREDCDDVLIIRNELITDSSYANLVFFDGKFWWTPDLPLLEGTCRARLLAQEIIGKAKLGVDDLKKFQGLKLINALRDMNQPMIPINRLVY